MEKKALFYVQSGMVERVKTIFQKFGYTLFAADSLEEALALFSREKPCLVVTHSSVNDYGDGYALLHRLEAQDQGKVRFKVLFISVDVRAVPWDFTLDQSLTQTLEELG